MSPLVREHLAIQFSTAMKTLSHDNIFKISDFPITCSRAVCHLGIINNYSSRPHGLWVNNPWPLLLLNPSKNHHHHPWSSLRLKWTFVNIKHKQLRSLEEDAAIFPVRHYCPNYFLTNLDSNAKNTPIISLILYCLINLMPSAWNY